MSGGARCGKCSIALTDGLAEGARGGAAASRHQAGERDGPSGRETLVLIDFGAARQAMGRHSRSVTAVLTPGYAPIEQYSARGHQGPWTDIYALGALAYWALSGKAPEEATQRVRADRLPPVAQVAQGRVSAWFAAAVDAALAVNEADRPQDLEEWRAMLDRPKPLLLAEEEAAKPPQQGAARVVGPETADERSGQGWAGRRRRLGLVAAAGLAVVALVYWVPRRVPDEELGSSEIVVEQPEPGTNGETGAGREDETGSAGEADPEADEARGETLVPDGGAAIEAALRLDRAARRAIQEGLAAAGFHPGVADGLFGAGTRDALRAWQADRGITETGYLTEASAEELRAGGAAALDERPTEVVAEEAEEVLLAVAEPGCEQWNTEEYFLTATVESVMTCLATSADVESRDDSGDTPLHFAAGFSDNPAVIDVLVAAGADVESRDDSGLTPLHRAAGFSDNPAVIDALVAAGADVESRDNIDIGLTPMHIAARRIDSSAAIDALVAAGADIESRDNAGATPLHYGRRFQRTY